MSIRIRPSHLYRTLLTTARRYSDNNKSIYQELEEGKKERTVYGEPYPDWRKPWIEREGEWKSKLNIFVLSNPSTDILHGMSKLPNLTVKDVKDWWAKIKDIQQIQNQKYLPERVSILGANLAAVHFFTYRNCTIRLKDSKDWITGDVSSLKLPSTYEDGYYIEAVDCSNFHHGGIRYEGLENLSNLNFLRWLAIRNNKWLDEWCFDRIAGQNGKSIEYLDVSGCNLCVGSIMAIARMTALKYLVITDPGDKTEIQAALSILEEDKPHLLIKTVDEELTESTKQIE